jgi:hypothetical protein
MLLTISVGESSVNGQQGGPADHQAGVPPSERAGPSWPI